MTTERKTDPVPDAVAALIRAAGRREEPPLEAYRIVLAASETTLRGKVRRRRWLRLGLGLAAALAVVVAVPFAYRALSPSTAVIEVARLDRQVGAIELREAGVAPWRVAAGRVVALRAGTRLRTHEGAAAGLALANGVSLRVDAVTEVEILEDARVRLRHGAVYADTGRGDGASISVTTPAGTAHDFGTQFEVRYEGERLALSVREGRVALLSSAEPLMVDAGTRLAVDAAGDVSRTTVATDDRSWQWAEAVAPVPDLDGKPVAALLAWVARETGLRLRYADAAVERQASATILHGAAGPLAPLDLLDVMLATTDFTYEVRDDGTIEVRRR